MQTIRTVAELRQALLQARKSGKRVGFIPTMGYLHEGHRALIEASRAQCDVSVVSIFAPLSSVQTTISAPIRVISCVMKNYAKTPGSRSSSLQIQRKCIRLDLRPSLSPASSQNRSAELSDRGISVVLPLSSAGCSTWYSQTSHSSGKRTSSNARSYDA